MNHFLLLLVLFIISSPNFATTTSLPLEPLTVTLIQSKINELNARQGLDAPVKTALLKQYQAAQDNLTSNAQSLLQMTIFTAALHQAPIQTKAVQKEIDQTLEKISKQKPEEFNQIPVEELEQRLIIEKGKISLLDEQEKKLEANLTLQNNRPALIREETVTAQQNIEDTNKKLALPAAPSDSKLEHEAQQLYFKTLVEMRMTELKLLDIEALSQPARLELLKAQIQLLDIQKNILIPIVTTIENLTFDLRQKEARKMQDALTQTEKELEGKHPLIQQLSHENIQYSRDLQAITAKIEQISEQKTQIENQTTTIENEFKSADKKISLAALNPALGKILREQRRHLTNANEVATEAKKLQNEIALTSLSQFKVDDEQKRLVNLDDALKQQMIAYVEVLLPINQRMMIQAESRVLLNNQKELLNKLALANTTYLRLLGDLDFSHQQMLTQAIKFAAYLDERLLWVTSSEPINLDTVKEFFHALQWLLSPLNGLKLLNETLQILWQNWLSTILTISFIGLVMRLQVWTQRTSPRDEIDSPAWHTDHFFFTLQVLLNRILSAAQIPVAIFLWGNFLTSHSSIDFNFAFGMGLQKAAVSLFIVQFCLHFFSNEGMARRHFQWQKSTVSLLHRHLLWMPLVITLAMFLIHATNSSKISAYSDSLGRLSLISMLIVIAVFMTKLLHPYHGLNPIRVPYSKGKIFIRYVSCALLVLAPLVIIGFAITGYYLSALELQEKLISTLRLFIIIVIVHEIVLRWLTLVNRQLVLKNTEQPHESHDKYEEVLPLDIPKINAQTKKLLHVLLTLAASLGFWFIWKNILPAFSFLDHIVLWQHRVIVENQEIYQPITLTNLLFASLYFFLALVAVRNFYGVLELFIFRHWTIEVGSRYATNQLAKYFFITVAFIYIANELGGTWAQVQWLVAALGVGLGFGLQEIFANLVSGIILLFERPIRVGDVVTIGDVTGSVCKIQMRATTLIDSEQRELIVPNKTFITSQLTNWTLSDATTRIVVPIGIAYESDVEQAHALILKTVKETPLILEEPAPFVLFIGFGDSALNFSIRAFVSEPINRWFVIHELNMRLEKTLRENNIKIPYPQHEVHIVSQTT